MPIDFKVKYLLKTKLKIVGYLKILNKLDYSFPLMKASLALWF